MVLRFFWVFFKRCFAIVGNEFRYVIPNSVCTGQGLPSAGHWEQAGFHFSSRQLEIVKQCQLLWSQAAPPSSQLQITFDGT